MADILFVCPECSKNLAVDSRAAGGEVPCSDCGARVAVPATVYVFQCPACEAELQAPPAMPVSVFQCPACLSQIDLPEDTRRAPAPVQASDGGTIRVRHTTPRPLIPAGAAALPSPPAAAPFTPRADDTAPAIFNSRSFVRRLWLTVFAAAALLLALIYLDVTFDTGLKVFDLLLPPSLPSARDPAPRPPATARAEAPAGPAAGTVAPFMSGVRDEAPVARDAPPPPASPPLPPGDQPAAAAAATVAVAAPAASAQAAGPAPSVDAAPPPAAAAADSPAVPPVLPRAVAEGRVIYDRHLAVVGNQHERRMEAWSEAYGKEVAALRDAMQRAGNLDGWIAVRQECERFEADRTIPDAAKPGMPPALVALQADFRSRYTEQVMAVSRETLALSERYVRHLELEQQGLTRAGRIDEAMLVRGEIERVRSAPIYSSAAFRVAADADRRAGDTPPPASSSNAAPPAVAMVTNAPAPAVMRAENSAGGPVIRRGGAAAVPGGAMLDRLAVRPTGAARDRDSYEVTVMRGVSSNVLSRADTAAGVTGSLTEIVLQHHIVVGLRTTSRTHRLDAVRVTIEYYVRGLGPAEGKEVPRRATVDTIELPELANEWVYIDCSPVTTRQVSSEYKGADFSRRTLHGEALHGVIVSLSRRGGKPVYEALAAVP